MALELEKILGTIFGKDAFNVAKRNFDAIEAEVNSHGESINYLDAEVDLKVDKAQPNWITATLQNGWTGTLQYRKNNLGQLEIKGGPKSGTITAGTVIATLPNGYYDTNEIILPAYGGNTYINLSLNNSGQILIRNNTNMVTDRWYSINSVYNV